MAGLLLCSRPLLLVLPTMLSATHHWCGHTTHGSCTWPSTSLHKACAYTHTHTHTVWWYSLSLTRNWATRSASIAPGVYANTAICTLTGERCWSRCFSYCMFHNINSILVHTQLSSLLLVSLSLTCAPPPLLVSSVLDQVVMTCAPPPLLVSSVL